MFEKVTELMGALPGPTSIILAGVHGDETCGVEALNKILPTLEIERGRVLFGYGNPRAIEENKRFIEANLNRMFKDDAELSEDERGRYEYGRAQFLKKCLGQAGALLDIHASDSPDSEPFVICEENAKEVVKYLPIGLIVSGFDAVEPGGTDYYMNRIGKIGICVECGYVGNPESVRTAEKSVPAFLKARGHIVNDLTPQKQSCIRVYKLYMTKTNSFILSKAFDDFEEISGGQIIGIDGVEEVLAEKDCVILFARSRKRIGDEAFLLGEKRRDPAQFARGPRRKNF